VVPFEGFIDMLQNYIFARWQVRMWCKLLTSVMFILIPLTASFSPTRYLPGFQDILDFDNPASVRNLIAGVAFILSDIIEFWVVLKGFMLSQSRNIQPKLKFFASIVDNRRIKICLCVMVGYFILFTFAWIWVPRDPPVTKKMILNAPVSADIIDENRSNFADFQVAANGTSSNSTSTEWSFDAAYYESVLYPTDGEEVRYPTDDLDLDKIWEHVNKICGIEAK
jgi:hypothetical protein